MPHLSQELVGRRLKKMLLVGVLVAAVGALQVLYAMNEVAASMPIGFAVGMLSLLLGAGMIFAATLGYIVVGHRQFQLRTLLAFTTVIAILFAAWSAWIGPTFFDQTSIKWHDGLLWIETGPGGFTNSNTDTYFVFTSMQFPIFGIVVLILPLIAPFLILPFVFRYSLKNRLKGPQSEGAAIPELLS
jgi:hypothetical protein